MAKKKKKESELARFSKETCDLPMTPMIDVTFLLLIFFMCTLKFKTLEGKLAAYLPKDVGVNQMAKSGGMAAKWRLSEPCTGRAV